MTPAAELSKEIPKSTREGAKRKTPDEFPKEQAYLGRNEESLEYISLFPTRTIKDSILSDTLCYYRREVK